MRWILVMLLLWTSACSDNDLVGLHIDLREDGSGTLTARSLKATTGPGPTEGAAHGMQWRDRVNLSSSQGSFQDLSKVDFGNGEVRFAVSENKDMPYLRVTIQRGPELSWVQSLVPIDGEIRRKLARVHDPSGKTKEVADTIHIEVQLPDAVVSSGITPAGRGIEASHERNRAYVLLPVKGLLQPGDELVWDISWK